MANTVPGRRVEKAQRTIHDVRVQLSGPDATPAPVHIQQGRIAQHEQRHAFKHAKLDHLQCGCAHGRPGVCSFEDRAPRLPRAPLTALRSTPRRSASAAMRHLQARRQLVAGRRGALFPRGVPVPPPPPSAPPTCPGAAAVRCAASSGLPVPRAGRHGTAPRAWHQRDAVCRLPRPVRGPRRCSGPLIPRPLRMPSGVGLSVCGVIIVSLTQK